ncbi:MULTISPECIES: phage tail assembly chaperone [Pseudomonas]|uniref:phage tail assembly chaperone n=1 Tax=Pseudomonas TaxID=286 RepID=UPI002118A233
MLIAVIEADGIEAGPGLVDLSATPEIGPASWFFAPEQRFVDPRPSPSHVWGGDGWTLDAVLDAEALAKDERAWRDAELADLVWLRDRHRDQLEIGAPTTLTPEQFTELLVFMQALRDWPQSEAFPDASARPVAPAFLEQMRIDQ